MVAFLFGLSVPKMNYLWALELNFGGLVNWLEYSSDSVDSGLCWNDMIPKYVVWYVL